MSNCEVICLQELVREQTIRASVLATPHAYLVPIVVTAGVVLLIPLLRPCRNSSSTRLRRSFSVSTHALRAPRCPSPSRSCPSMHVRAASFTSVRAERVRS